jgi:adenine-specific DNA methylase
MPEWNRIQTLQYMGSKGRMLDSICMPIIENKNIDTVIDLFAGTGVVGFALAPYKKIISNDIEYYAYILNEAILNGCDISNEEIKKLLDEAKKQCLHMEENINDAIEEERRLLSIDAKNYSEYARFSDDTPSVFHTDTTIDSLQQLSSLAKLIKPGSSEQDIPFPCLFLTYFANAYFGIRQCCEIDAIVSQIQQMDDKHQRFVLLTALMSVLSATASTTTHFAQFLKVKSKSTFKNIAEKRSTNIFDMFEVVIKRFDEKGLLKRNRNESKCFNLNDKECLDSIQMNDHTLVYADPPYFKEHYSRYYHVLNTLCLYDYPALALNPQTGKFSVGRYRADRISSDFGKRATVLSAFRKLIDKCADNKAELMISYSENSLVKIHELIQLAKERYIVRMDKVGLKHSSQGRATESDQTVNEYLFICTCPDDRDIEIERAAEEIRNIKPIVDNPAGFIHNYMARKPYNIVSKIISEFTDENDVVYDPMFGSGTTLIEASKLGRVAIGADLNPLAVKLCGVSLKEWDLPDVFKTIEDFKKDVESECSKLYTFEINGETRVIERCHFDFVDDRLVPTAYWYKVKSNGKLSGRKKTNADSYILKNYQSFASKSVSRIHDRRLIPNSRIAIKDGTTVFSYFCKRNLVALDKIFSILDRYKTRYGYETLEIIVSSAINLIKLSDKKASSQMPFWLPQKNVTSRNAVFIIEQKAKAMEDGLKYLKEKCKSFVDEKRVFLYNKPSQNLSIAALPDNTVDLVLTDPPYTDQVPYLEYSQLWFYLNEEKNIDFEDELVVSDATSRDKTYDDFNNTFDKIIERTAKALKLQGVFVMFYHTFDLKSWQHILSMMQNHGLKYVYQIPTAAPRKSFKTVMSPRSTLDGNYLLFFTKESRIIKQDFSGELSDAETLAVECAERIIQSSENVTTQDLYDHGMLKEAFEGGYLAVLSQNYKTFADVVKKYFDYHDGYWEERK